MAGKPVFTIFTLAYQRMDYLKESLEAMLRQTYPHVEIIIVNNGAIPEVLEYIKRIEQKDSRVKIVHFEKNQYCSDDPGRLIRVCFNAALKAATGDFIWYQSDDDLMSNDYVEKMVALFEENPACTSAAGLVKDMDASGRLLTATDRSTNYRPRFMPGHLLALSTLNDSFLGSNCIMFDAPGSIFAFRREELIQKGGYHPAIERSHMYGVVPFGVTGFDETAVFYWRRHEGQLNKYMNAQGDAGQKAELALLQEWHIEKRWEIFGTKMSRYVLRKLYGSTCDNGAVCFAINVFYFRPLACLSIVRDMYCHFGFWLRIPVQLWKQKVYFKYFLKTKIRKIFEAYPWLVKKVPGLLPLQNRAFK